MLKLRHEFDKSAPLAHNRSPFAVRRSPFAVRRSPFAVRCSPFADNSASVKNAKSSGFTIIEVALVLAIAGLIFLVVFLALPALQSAQRENALKQRAARIAAAIEQFYADGGNAADVPSSRPRSAKGDDPTSVWGKIPNPQLDSYLKDVATPWIYGNKDFFTDTGAAPGRSIAPLAGKGGIDVYFSDKCWTADSPAGGRYPGDKQFVPGSPWDVAVVARFDSGVAYCVGVGR